MFSKIAILMTAVAVAVHAQGDASTTASAPDASSSVIANLSPCIVACIGPAAQANGCTFTDPSCVCASAQFITDATACLQEHCTPEELAAAVQLQTSQCAAASIIPTGSVTTTNSLPFSLPTSGSQTASNSRSSSSGSSASTSASSSSATSPNTSASTTPSSAAGALVANSGVAAFFGAILAGVVAL